MGLLSAALLILGREREIRLALERSGVKRMEDVLTYEFEKILQMFLDKHIPIGDVISIRTNQDLGSKYGRCIIRYIPYYDVWRYEIEIGPRCFEDVEILRETIVHELCHTVQGAQEHNEIWLYWVNQAADFFDYV